MAIRTIVLGGLRAAFDLLVVYDHVVDYLRWRFGVDWFFDDEGI